MLSNLSFNFVLQGTECVYIGISNYNSSLESTLMDTKIISDWIRLNWNQIKTNKL